MALLLLEKSESAATHIGLMTVEHSKGFLTASLILPVTHTHSYNIVYLCFALPSCF